MSEVDLINRDPNGINSDVQVKFEDVLAEPEGAHSIDCVWKCSYSCYTCGLSLAYKILTILCGIFLALYWGCLFGCSAFHQIWILTPCCKMFEIYVSCMKRTMGIALDCLISPCCAACGMCFSNIVVTNKSG